MKLTKAKLIETIRRKNDGWTTYKVRKIAGISIRRVNQVWEEYLQTGILYCKSSSNPDNNATVSCSQGCTGDVPSATCVSNTSVCGNNVVESGETCDGTSLSGQTCLSQGFDSGTLACLSSCSSFDTSSCYNYNNTCSDSENGWSPYNPGTVSGNFQSLPYSYSDLCVDNGTVQEWRCLGNNADSFNQICPVNSSTTCVNGACV